MNNHTTQLHSLYKANELIIKAMYCLQLIFIPPRNTSKVYDNKKKKKSVNFLFQILKNQINIKIDFYFLKIKLKMEEKYDKFNFLPSN